MVVEVIENSASYYAKNRRRETDTGQPEARLFNSLFGSSFCYSMGGHVIEKYYSNAALLFTGSIVISLID